MAKRWLALILGILMAFPLSAWAEGSAAMQIEASAALLLIFGALSAAHAVQRAAIAKKRRGGFENFPLHPVTSC